MKAPCLPLSDRKTAAPRPGSGPNRTGTPTDRTGRTGYRTGCCLETTLKNNAPHGPHGPHGLIVRPRALRASRATRALSRACDFSRAPIYPCAPCALCASLKYKVVKKQQGVRYPVRSVRLARAVAVLRQIPGFMRGFRLGNPIRQEGRHGR